MSVLDQGTANNKIVFLTPAFVTLLRSATSFQNTRPLFSFSLI
jgi:hypothetical protein